MRVGHSEGRQSWESPASRRGSDSYLIPALVQLISGPLKALTEQAKGSHKTHTGILRTPHLAGMSYNL